MARKKTKEQIAAMQETQHAAEAAMEAVVEYLRSADAPSSEEAHRIIDSVLDAHNCESPEGHIIAGGTASAEPHETGSGSLLKGVPIVIDIYPRSKATGYYADISRTVCIGTPEKELQRMYDAVLAAQELAISMLGPGVKCVDIHRAVENLFAEHGYKTSGKGEHFEFAEGFVHSTGHGVGTKIHEAPRIGRGSKDILMEGDVVTIEPALYYRNLGGIRLEDMLYITENGAENLTAFPKEFKLT